MFDGPRTVGTKFDSIGWLKQTVIPGGQQQIIYNNLNFILDSSTTDQIYIPGAKYFLEYLFHPPCKNVIFVLERSYITPAVRRSMLDVPAPGSFRNISHLVWGQEGSDHVNHVV